jgi:hypothetical protein
MRSLLLSIRKDKCKGVAIVVDKLVTNVSEEGIRGKE